MVRRFIIQTYKQAKRLVIVVVGFTLFLIGIIMIVLPGPGAPIVLIGLAILATEFLWARRVLRKFKETVDQMSTPQKAKAFFLKNKLRLQQKVSQFFKKTDSEGSIPEKSTIIK